MKLKSYEASLSEKMSEFDIWVTPSLGEIRDTPQFRENLDTLKHGFDLLSQLTDNFVDYSHCSSSVLSNNTIEYTKLKDEDTAIDILNSIWNVLLLATGKTDNNLKCQYPLLLRNTYENSDINVVFPTRRRPYSTTSALPFRSYSLCSVSISCCRSTNCFISSPPP